MSEPRVTGVGGVFFRARDPDALRSWYREHLGAPSEDGTIVFRPAGGMLLFGLFERDTDHFGSQEQQWMVNLRVNDLDGLLARLAAAGVEPMRREDETGVGRFAWIEDPEGNRVELWEPVEGL